MKEELYAKLNNNSSSTKDLKLLKDKMELDILQKTLKSDITSRPNSKGTKRRKRENSLEKKTVKFEETKGMSPLKKTAHRKRDHSSDNTQSQKVMKTHKKSKRKVKKNVMIIIRSR